MDTPGQDRSMYPFTLTRAFVDLPVGLLTLREKWESLLSTSSSKKQRLTITLNSGILPSILLAKHIQRLKPKQSLLSADGIWLAANGRLRRMPIQPSAKDLQLEEGVDRMVYPWDLLTQLEKAIALDFSILTKRRRSQPLPKTVLRIGKHPIFVSKGAKLLPCTLNATAGPIYIGPNAEIQEGVAIRGPFLMGEGSVVKMGATIYGPAAIGQGCLLGGELKRSLILPFSNKAHHGYMGDSVIGSWCNWGAGTSNSNLKNTAGEIRISVGGVSVAVGQKAGVFMGDHSRTAINTSLNSGSVMGVSVQVGNDGLSPKQISSFRWMDGKKYRINDALQHIRNWKALKGHELSDREIEQLTHIYKSDKSTS